MTKNPLVSVIIPCYNVAAYVEKAISSILSQTYKNLELWIIDDASTDNTLEKIRKFHDNRIKVICYETNTKKVGAVNEVLQKVNGDFICFQDADDWSEPNRIEEQLEQFRLKPALGICFTSYKYAGINRSIGKIAVSNDDLRREFLEFFKDRSAFTSPTCCPTMMITRTVLQQTSGYNPFFAGRVAEDIQWIYRILKNYEGVTLKKVLYHYSNREGSFTQIEATGRNAKYSYSCHLLSKIIDKDIHENIDVFDPVNAHELSRLELEACEEALMEAKKLVVETKNIYENSMSFKIGKFILKPLRIVKALRG